MSELTLPAPDAIAELARREIDRAVKRNIKGLEFLAAGTQPVGAMEKDVVYRKGTAVLYRYRPLLDEIYRTPFLLVSPPSNRGYIFDLAKGQSFVEFMLNRGYDVFNLDWNPPRRDEAELGLGDYVDGFIPESISRIREMTGETQVSLAGYCMGGTLAVIHAALYGKASARNLVAFATPVDFHHMTLFQKWADRRHFDLDLLIEELDVVPPNIMMGAFDLARPANRTAGKMNLWTNMWNDEYVKSYRMFDRWAAETLPVPGTYFRQLIEQLLWDNALKDGRLEIGGRIADLSNISMPVLNITAIHDHVVSKEATEPLMEKSSSRDTHEIVSKGGHVSLVAGPAAVKRLWPHIDAWLSRRSA